MTDKDTCAVVKWICSGHTLPDIEEAITAKLPGNKPKDLIKKAIAHIAQSGEVDNTVIKGYAFESYKMLQAKMMEIGDFQGAMKAVKEIVALTKQQTVKKEKVIEIESF